MIINEEGTYTLKYTATDECGKSSTVDRELVVTDNSPRRTVLYTDGTFIINEKQTDEAHNIELHGAATNVYIPFDPNGATNIEKYIFTSSNEAPWNTQAASIKSVEIGSSISPTSTAYWFHDFSTCANINLANLNTSITTKMNNMFYYCQALTSLDVSNLITTLVDDMSYMFRDCQALTNIDVSNFDTSSVTNMSNMFGYCQALTSLDLSNFDTSSVTNMSYMFASCRAMETIYVSSNFVVSQVTASSNMFAYMTNNLVGGAGTTWASGNPKDKTYAHIDGGTSNPGYFTAKS